MLKETSALYARSISDVHQRARDDREFRIEVLNIPRRYYLIYANARATGYTQGHGKYKMNNKHTRRSHNAPARWTSNLLDSSCDVPSDRARARATNVESSEK
jgi:hypothetical protein